MNTYEAFGYIIASNIPLQILECRHNKPPDIVFTVKENRTEIKEEDMTGFLCKNDADRRVGGERPTTFFFDQRRVVLYPGEACYTIRIGQPTQISCDMFPRTQTDVVADTLVDEILCLVIFMLGGIAFHAGCVELDGVRFSIFGDSGFGKSTTVTSLSVIGCDFLSDDVTIGRINGDHLEVRSSYPFVRLWDSSANSVIPVHKGIPIASMPGKKRYRVTDWTAFKQDWRKLQLAYLMKPCDPEAAGSVTPLSKMTAFITLLKSTMMGFALTAREWELVQRVCFQISNWTRFYILSYPRKLECAEELADLIVRHVGSIK